MPILKQIEKKLDLNFFQKQVPLKNKSKIFKNALKTNFYWQFFKFISTIFCFCSLKNYIENTYYIFNIFYANFFLLSIFSNKIFLKQYILYYLHTLLCHIIKAMRNLFKFI